MKVGEQKIFSLGAVFFLDGNTIQCRWYYHLIKDFVSFGDIFGAPANTTKTRLRWEAPAAKSVKNTVVGSARLRRALKIELYRRPTFVGS